MDRRHDEADTLESSRSEVLHRPSERVVRLDSESDDYALRWPLDRPVRLLLGSVEAPPLELLDGEDVPQLGADLLVVQPEVIRADARRGWLPIGGVYSDAVCIGRTESPSLNLDPRASREHLYVHCTRQELILVDVSKNGTWVLVEDGGWRSGMG